MTIDELKFGDKVIAYNDDRIGELFHGTFITINVHSNKFVVLETQIQEVQEVDTVALILPTLK